MSGEEPAGQPLVYRPEIRSRADAKRIVRLCCEGELDASWHFSGYYRTVEGLIPPDIKMRADAVLAGAWKPDPGRPAGHDWGLVRNLAREVEGTLRTRTQVAVRKEVKLLYKERTGKEISSESETFKRTVREALRENTAG